jgi:CRISPR-associated endonuclease/helicase Cas3
MMVTFVSQCEKKALNKTRRVLDAFANRIGDNTWQTVITQDGLNAVKKLLRKTASKSTAVSCHWIRSRSRSELVWIVGKRDKFDLQGHVPVNTSRRNLLQSQIENDWHYLPLIKALAGLAALLHDWGKASELFQAKLDPKNREGFKGDPIRHEWISCLLLNALVQQHASSNGSDQAWLQALSQGEINEDELKLVAAQQRKNPLSDLPPAAKLLSWLIVSHHRLPLPQENQKALRTSWIGIKADSIDLTLSRITKEWGYENRFDEEEYQSRLSHCFEFPNGLISASKPWLMQVKKWAKRLLDCEPLVEQTMADGSYRVLLHHSRLCLMLGDHYYSSKDADKKWQDTLGLFANTDRETRCFKQKLDEHLVGVARHALNTAHLLPAFEKEPPQAQDIASLKKLSPTSFRWQDKAVEKIKKWRVETLTPHISGNSYGFFTVNMASTGCGKTFANAKVMRALSDDGNSLRYILALGLRTLTLQTGDEYRDRIGLDNSELAVLIGSRAVMELHEQNKRDDENEKSYENTGSLSQESLLDEDVDYDCAIPEGGLSTVLTCDRDRNFLYAPVLTCTIDHMMAATETKRGGRYILPSLRLMSSDLVIDEVDDFTGDDLIAIARLVHLAGMLGRKVMISSATIPPDLAEGYFKAYRDGWQLYCKTRDANRNIGCAWIDEFNTKVISNNEADLPNAILGYRNAHTEFINHRVKKLQAQPAKRKADISQCQFLLDQPDHQHNDELSVESRKEAYFETIANSAVAKHQDHSTTDLTTGLAISFGVVRMANISPCIALTRYLLEREWPTDTEVRVMAYHSQQVLLMRSEQERHLDQVLKRKEHVGEQPKAFSNSVIRKHLDQVKARQSEVKHMLFILVATPVEEVGRDHDFDWAVVEPSSYRSIVQLAGRVRRHREGEVYQPNISLLQYNWKGIENYGKELTPVFVRPGFETFFPLKTHNLVELIDEKVIAQKLDAIPRIQKPLREQFNPQAKLADLEHADTKRLLTLETDTGPQSLMGYLRETWFLTALPQQLTAFRQSDPSLKVFLVYDSNTDRYFFCEKDEQGHAINREKPLGIVRSKLSESAQSRLWFKRDFAASVEKMAEAQELSQRRISLRYGELSFRHNEKKQYEYNDQLGLVKI